jgi:hypothetical protein
MSSTVPTIEPTAARAGDTWAWTRDLSDYPAGTWTLTYSLFSSAAVYSITATADGTQHSVSVPGATTKTYIAGRYDWVAHVSDGTDRYQVGSGVIQILPNIAAVAEAATLVTGVVASNNALTWTAVTAGTAGNSLTVTLLDPDTTDASLTVSVTGSTAVRASLATDSGGTITTTAAELTAAVAASITASALVTVADTSGSSGAGVVTALASTSLSGGRDAYSTYDGRSHARKMLDAINAILDGRALSADLDLIRTSFGDRQAEYDLANLLKMRQQYAFAVQAEDNAERLARGEPSGRFIATRFRG